MPLTSSLLLRRAIFHRRGRLLTALTGLTLSAAILTAMAALYADLGAKLNRSFAAFGPNVLVTAQSNQTLPPDFNATLTAISSRAEFTTCGVVLASANARPAPVLGCDLPAFQQLHASWDWRTPAPAGAAAPQAFIGDRLWRALGQPSAITLIAGGTPLPVTVARVFSSGGAEDNQLYIPQPDFAAWTHLSPTLAEVHIPGSALEVDAAAARLAVALPGVQVQPVRQLVEGQSHIFRTTRVLMFSAAAIVIATLAIAVLATLSAMVLDRRRDYAVMKAIGCPRATLHSLFLAETATLALAGAAAGLFLGVAAALLIGELNFHTRIALHWQILPLAFVANALIAVVASVWPLRSLSAVEPAALLRGE